jgi:trans-2,3-dihydro-3-hydroxyanthranilate isomerase
MDSNSTTLESTTLRYRVVDVFTKRQLEGNALAVFPDAAAIDGTTMQRIARELNLAETVFVLPPTRSDCVAKVRIFTPLKEMLFAGHPTIGTAFVLLDEGLVQTGSGGFVLEEKIGPVPVRVEMGEEPMLWIESPPIKEGREYDSDLCSNVLGLKANELLDIPPKLLNAGNPTVFVALRNKDAVDRAWLDLAGAKQLRGLDREPFCTFVFTPTPEGAYSRMFAPEYGVPEDPATGSSTGLLAAYMMRHGLFSNSDGARFVSEQGTKMGRRSYLHVLVRGENGIDGIEIGGHVTPVASASMHIAVTEDAL